MKTRLIKIGNSQGIMLSKTFIKQYNFSGQVTLEPVENGLLIRPAGKSARADWATRFREAVKDEEPEAALLGGFTNEFDEIEWQW